MHNESGHLSLKVSVRKPELRYLPSGDPVCIFSLATTERWQDRAWHQPFVPYPPAFPYAPGYTRSYGPPAAQYYAPPPTGPVAQGPSLPASLRSAVGALPTRHPSARADTAPPLFASLVSRKSTHEFGE